MRSREMGEGSQKVQTSRCKINKSWDVVYSMTTVLIIMYYIFHKLFCIFESF